MKFISIVYIFALYVLLTPGILFTTIKPIHALLYSGLLFLSFDIVNVPMKEFLKKQTNNDENYHDQINVTFSNKIVPAPKDKALGNLLIESFEYVSKLEVNIKTLQTIIASYKGTQRELNELKKLVEETKNILADLQIQLEKFNAIKNKIDNLNKTINTLERKEKKLSDDFTQCQIDIQKVEQKVMDEETKRDKLNNDINNLQTKIDSLTITVNESNAKIPVLEEDIRKKIDLCNLRGISLSYPWISEYT